MAHFYGEVQGSRGPVHRLGGASSGLKTIAASYQGAVSVQLYEEDGVDMARVSLCRWQGSGVYKVLYEGPVDK